MSGTTQDGVLNQPLIVEEMVKKVLEQDEERLGLVGVKRIYS
jgi:hypothetical protein